MIKVSFFSDRVLLFSDCRVEGNIQLQSCQRDLPLTQSPSNQDYETYPKVGSGASSPLQVITGEGFLLKLCHLLGMWTGKVFSWFLATIHMLMISTLGRSGLCCIVLTHEF